MLSQNMMSLFIRKSPLGCPLLASICIFLLLAPVLCSGHSEDSPSFKYSKEANENFDPNTANLHHHDHGHRHHDHDHGHHDHDHGHHDHNHDHHEHHGNHQHSNRDGESRKNLDMSRVWLHAISSTLLISAAPFVLLYIIPLDNSEAMKPRLKVILAFASGGLLGDAFLHLIPHATHPHDHGEHNHDHNHDHMDKNDHTHAHSHTHDMTVGLWVLAGIIAFLSVEKIVRLLKGGSNHGHSHSNSLPKKSAQSNGKQNDKKTVKSTKVQKQDVAISGYLNLAADFAHNFTDGLAIGASYLAGNSIGVITTITILLHEVPHEIGDFAILIKSGCSKRKAMMLQLLTAVGAVGGTALALFGAGTDNVTASWVLPFTAGGFIYIATVSVLPELLEESTKFIQSLKEIIALLGGVALMVFIANFE